MVLKKIKRKFMRNLTLKHANIKVYAAYESLKKELRKLSHVLINLLVAINDSCCELENAKAL